MKQKSNTTSNTKNPLKAIIAVIAACAVFGVMQGVHDNYGIMMNGLLKVTGVDYEGISFSIGVGALVYGIGQPFWGMLALRKSNSFSIFLGIIFMIIGLLATPLCRNAFPLLLFFGIVLPFGTAGLEIGIMMGALAPVINQKQAAFISGVIQASAGIGDALMSPALTGVVSKFGIRIAMHSLTVPFLIMIPVIFWLAYLEKTAPHDAHLEESRTLSLWEILNEALKDKDYQKVSIAFATCGFNMSIIEAHLFSQYLSWGIDRSVVSLTLTVYGITTMIGAVAAGALCLKFKMQNVLGCTYGLRILISLGFLFLPRFAPTAFLLTGLLGLCGDATVPSTTSIISTRFGPERLAVLYGFALIGHQIGAFASSYLGGILVQNDMGYEPLWIVNLCLACIASAASFSIGRSSSLKERPAQ